MLKLKEGYNHVSSVLIGIDVKLVDFLLDLGEFLLAVVDVGAVAFFILLAIAIILLHYYHAGSGL
jgi:hypothetical protein